MLCLIVKKIEESHSGSEVDCRHEDSREKLTEVEVPLLLAQNRMCFEEGVVHYVCETVKVVEHHKTEGPSDNEPVERRKSFSRGILLGHDFRFVILRELLPLFLDEIAHEIEKEY